jgi:hypothetical protein
MLERRELAVVIFGTGLVLIVIGFWGLGGGRTLDYAVMGSGLGAALVSTLWWQVLRPALTRLTMRLRCAPALD